MESILRELPYALPVALPSVIGLWLSNVLYDRHIPHYVSRKVGHAFGGMSFLLGLLLFHSAVLPIALCAVFGLALWLARILRPSTFRGVGGSGRSKRVMAEVWFIWIAVPLLAIGWWWLNQPVITIACLLFMAWGDCITGLVRARVYRKSVKGLWGSLAMLIVCLGISAAFIHPFWIGAIGAVAASITEWSCGDCGIVHWADDNWAVPAVSLIVILGMLAWF